MKYFFAHWVKRKNKKLSYSESLTLPEIPRNTESEEIPIITPTIIPSNVVIFYIIEVKV